MIKVAIVGGGGYTGGEIIRILQNHKKVKVVSVFEIEDYKDKEISKIFPNLRYITDLRFEIFEIDKIKNADLFFLCLPHTVSSSYAEKILKNNKKIIDLSADFRFSNINTYENWYKVKHPAPELSKIAVYGLPEIYKEKIKSAKLVANPGCYPTSVILGIAPILDKIKLKNIIVDSKSGVSGAGRKPAPSLHFPECQENVKPYSVGKHRHIPEIEEQLSILAKKEVKIVFTPHLLPTIRGILSTIYLKLEKKIDYKELLEIYKNFYRDSYFVRILEDEVPQTKTVLGSNFCDIGIVMDERNDVLIVISAIDNLIKGASGQAVQNMNIMFGFKENEGLENFSLYP
jgi:N-acetyl-gamma-glutamyl-phosphate reductase